MTQGGRDRPEVRALGLDDAERVFEVDQWAFGFDTEGRDRQPEIELLDWSRVRGAPLDGGRRGVYPAPPQDLPVPGGSVPTAGVTWVGVPPGARRRGVMTAMMRDHLEGQLLGGREPVSTLFAAE